MTAADYPFLDVVWTIAVFFAWAVWLYLVITIVADLLRRRDVGGVGKVAWIIGVILLPFLGVLVYLLVNHAGMAGRSRRQVTAQQERFDDYVASVATAGGPAAQVEHAKRLLDAGAITQAEYDQVKAKTFGYIVR